MAGDADTGLVERVDVTPGNVHDGRAGEAVVPDERAILGRPRLLILDEPTEGVWIGVIEEIAERLQQLAREISLVVVEQHVDLALRVADRAYVMDRGGVALHRTSHEVRHHPDLVRYLAP